MIRGNRKVVTLANKSREKLATFAERVLGRPSARQTRVWVSLRRVISVTTLTGDDEILLYYGYILSAPFPLNAIFIMIITWLADFGSADE